MQTDELDFQLPAELIAQEPLAERSASRLLHYRRADRSIGHRIFAELPRLLRRGDLLVFNDTRVIPARFLLRKPSGGLVEGLFLEELDAGQWRVMLRNLGGGRRGLRFVVDADQTDGVQGSGRRWHEGTEARRHEGEQRPTLRAFVPLPALSEPALENLRVDVIEQEPEGVYRIALRSGEAESERQADKGTRRQGDKETEAASGSLRPHVPLSPCPPVPVSPCPSASSLLERLGRMPLPPYIRRHRGRDPHDELDRQRYQTVFARAGRSVAAPTAALHFTPRVFDELADAGIERCFVTLEVGMGTFKPVTADQLEGHNMHVERYGLSAEAADQLNRARRDGRRIIAVGTTSARVLESQPADRPIQPHSGQTGIFIYPPYRWKHAGGLITNFHLPRSTLIALVAALVGLDEQRRIYREAIDQRYRFFSYGDAMLVE